MSQCTPPTSSTRQRAEDDHQGAQSPPATHAFRVEALICAREAAKREAAAHAPSLVEYPVKLQPNIKIMPGVKREPGVNIEPGMKCKEVKDVEMHCVSPSPLHSGLSPSPPPSSVAPPSSPSR
ncbi:hypothetical protein C8F04DRAFT_1267215 [Mycena alexandri]|uniref:Uncharacterized protein n=1 Tax=Mycena alexandri TaxID=1745969 RepID=A0AAD6SKE0_9AGAR|nr:hypothetical protein C8F04DRAFT_1267215 [Mycena alexandri]